MLNTVLTSAHYTHTKFQLLKFTVETKNFIDWQVPM